MSFNIAVETIVVVDKLGGEKRCAVSNTILEFTRESLADNYFNFYDKYENPGNGILNIYRKATKLY